MAVRVNVTKFEDIMRRCHGEGGLGIEVEFAGGEAALVPLTLQQLRPMAFKWRQRGDASGPDWIGGDRFRQLVREKQTMTSAPPAVTTRGGANYYDKAGSLGEMTGICRTHGAGVIVGFEDGRGALRRSTPAALKARQFYKWDWTDHPTGVKHMSNWIPGGEFLAILAEVDALRE
jgi:hypothetical protein